MTRQDGSWDIDLGGLGYRELWLLGQMLEKLGDKGNINGQRFDLETLHAKFNNHTGEVDLYDEEGNTTEEDEEE